MTRQRFIDLLLSSSKVEVRDPKILGNIKLLKFQVMLLKGGWEKKQEGSIYEGPRGFDIFVAPIKDDFGSPIEICVPSQEPTEDETKFALDKAVDYANRMIDLIDTFRAVEQEVRQEKADGQGMGGGRMIPERTQIDVLYELLVY